ncbi:hypothetical protein V1509DRAFT_676962 [Lipomyces kononenkoae]
MSARRDDLIVPRRDAEGGFQVFSLNNRDAGVREYKRRRMHAKAHSGCLACRAKRVKCDELKPVCARCCRNGRSCVYGQPSKDGRWAEGFSILTPVTVVPFSAPSAQNGTSSIHLMQHFERHWAEIFGFARSDEVFALSKSHSLVRNTILAVAACHLRHVSPGVLQHRIAEHFQQCLALRDCQKFLATPPTELGQSGVNALMFSAMLLNMLAFTLPESETSSTGEPDLGTSWVFSTHEHRLGWLALQEGLRHVLRSTAAYLGQAMIFLGQVFLGPDNDPWVYSAFPHSLNGLPEKWIKFFKLENAAYGCECGPAGSVEVVGASSGHSWTIARDKRGEILRPALVALLHSLNAGPVGFNIFKYFPFLSKVHSEFRTLLYDRDEKALWLFGYWLGLMSRFEGLWWCDKRVNRDYKAIRLWLEQAHVTLRPGVEGEMWREMMEEFDKAAVVPT